ncbi:MAG: hypothetical protein GF393_01120 [Armatimonadia bacterium]|nr:hypothetical protein [Armatimonadia bacterium]
MLQDEQPMERRVLAAHLAAHAVCAHLVGRAVRGISLEDETKQRPWEDTTPVAIRAGYLGETGSQVRVEEGWLIGEGMILAAGMAADFMLTGSIDREGARDDLQQLDRFAAYVRTGAATWAIEVFGMAVDAVRGERVAVQELANALLMHVELDAKAVEAFLEEYCGGGAE